MVWWWLIHGLRDFVVMRRWNRKLLMDMEAHPEQKVKVLDTGGEPIGWGILSDSTGPIVAIPFDWHGSATSVQLPSGERRPAAFVFDGKYLPSLEEGKLQLHRMR